MNQSKTEKPATAETVNGLPNSDRLGSKINLTNTPNPAKPQVDDCGESDLEFFRRRPNVNSRVRLPIDGEFPAGMIEPSRAAFVHVLLVTRDPKTNAPGTRARAVFYADNEGGTA